MEIQLWKHISCSPSLAGQWPQNPRVTPKEQCTYTLNSGRIIEQQSGLRTQESRHRTEQSNRVAPEPSSHSSTLLKKCVKVKHKRGCIYMRNSGGKVDHISRHTTPRHSTLLLTRQKSPPRPTQVPHPNFFSETITVYAMLSFTTLFCDFENQKKWECSFFIKSPKRLWAFKWRQ